jgi:hypothetical protein
MAFVRDPDTVLPQIHVGPHKAKPAGHYLSAPQGQWSESDFLVPEDLHLQEAWSMWEDAELGDFLRVDLVNPSTRVTVNAAANAGENVIDVGTTDLGGGYLFGNLFVASTYGVDTVWIEVWNSTRDDLIEVAEVSNVNVAAGLVAIVGTLVNAVPADAIVTARFGSFNPPQVGFYTLGSGDYRVPNQHTMTGVFPKDTCVSLRYKAVGGGVTRKIVCNYLWREPAA